MVSSLRNPDGRKSGEKKGRKVAAHVLYASLLLSQPLFHL